MSEGNKKKREEQTRVQSEINDLLAGGVFHCVWWMAQKDPSTRGLLLSAFMLSVHSTRVVVPRAMVICSRLAAAGLLDAESSTAPEHELRPTARAFFLAAFPRLREDRGWTVCEIHSRCPTDFFSNVPWLRVS